MRRRRGVVAALAAVLVLTALGVLALEFGWPRYRPPLRAGETYALDVSNHQGTIDWPAVARDDVDAAYLKATEGATFEDPTFEANWRQARAAGLRVGAYHFFTLCRSGTEQAANLLRALERVEAVDDTAALPVALDLELDGNCAARPPREQVQQEVDDFVSTVEEATRRPLVYYVMEPWAERYPPLQERPRWVRSLARRPAGDWVWWQVHNRAQVDGVDGPVDLNVVRTTD